MEQRNILNAVNSPEDLKGLNEQHLTQLAGEMRSFIVETVSHTGGHLGANLGVVELSIALHKVFNAPSDKIIWDVGHQCYPHKILTRRKDKMRTLRQEGGISGFTKQDESSFDCFGAGHSSTSISAALGMAEGAKIQNKAQYNIAVIGDGSMSAGMAFEALNHAGEINSNVIVVLNDNDMSIDAPSGGLSKHLSQITSTKEFKSIKNIGKKLATFLPGGIEGGRIIDEKLREVVGNENSTLFSAFGFLYFGPVNGHDLSALTSILENLKEANYNKPILLHVKTQKGKGYEPAEQAKDYLHGVTQFNPKTGEMNKAGLNTPTYTQVAANHLFNLASKDPEVVAITAAMPSGTGLKRMQQELPKQFFDVGIAEQHAITFAAGLATQKIKPFVALYSSFLQRGWDQLIHDVALQNLPVRFLIDRAGFVGADGATHAGLYDLSMCLNQPNFIVMAPSCGSQLQRCVETAYTINNAPTLIRYPRGHCTDDTGLIEHNPKPLEIGKGIKLFEGESNIAILSIGTILTEVLKAQKILKTHNINPTLIDAVFANPIDESLIENIASSHKALIIIEENGLGGFASKVSQHLLNKGFIDNGLKLRILNAPKEPIHQATQERQLELAGLDAKHIVKLAQSLQQTL